MSREEELKLIIENATAELWKIREANKIAEMSAYIGRFFKSQNHNYHEAGEELEWWWEYNYITDLDEDGDPLSLFFCKDTDNRILISKNNSFYLGESCQEITADEFWGMYSTILDELNSNILKHQS